MPIDVQRLAEVVRAFRRLAEAAKGSFLPVPLDLVGEELHSLANEALVDDSEMVPVVVGLIYLMVDIRDGVVPEDVSVAGLQRLEECFSQGWLPRDWATQMAPFVLRGGEIQESQGPKSNGCTLMRWGAFCDHYAASYSWSKFSPPDMEQFWNRVERGRIELLESELHLDGPNGLVWFTDENRVRESCPATGGNGIDANQAYDWFGLDWSRLWEDKDDQGRKFARAVLLSVPLERRRLAAKGSRATTAMDGWGCLCFVPGDLRRGGSWPSVGSFTVNPLGGQRCLPEGVHGELYVDPGVTCPVNGCGRVAKAVSNRLEECGREIIERALSRI